MGDFSSEFVADILIAVDGERANAIGTRLAAHRGVRTIKSSGADDLINRLSSERYDALIISETFGGLIYQGLVSLVRSGDLCAPNLPIVLAADHETDGLEDLEKRYFVKATGPSGIPWIDEAVREAIAQRPRPSVLLIDDNDHFLDLLAEHLEGSFRVVTTSSPERAGEIFHQVSPDIVVSDYSMPFKDGEGVARELRALSEETPIVILTAHDTPRNHIALTKAGITRFLSKKAPLPEIERTLRELVLETAINRASKAAAQEAGASGRLVRAIQAARRDLGVGRAAFAAERLKNALMRNLKPPTDDDPEAEDQS